MTILLALIFSLGSFVCLTDQFQFGKLEIVSDLMPKDCYDQGLNYTAVDKTSGLAKCTKFVGRPTICSQYYYNKSRAYNGTYPPTCGKDGWLAPVPQCKGDRVTGRCFCKGRFAKRLYGQQWWNKADDMTCACSYKKDEMKDQIQYFNSLHCSSEGNFEPLQCDVESEQCWCTNEKTGDLTSIVVPEKVKSKLPCYSTLKVGSKYLRQCDSNLYARKRILYELSLHGTKFVNFGELLCDEDGSFGAYTVIDGAAYCTWKDGIKIGSYQYAGDRSTLNCYCARDTRIFKDAGKTLNVACNGGGNYIPFQTGDKYCVDSDGYRITQPTDHPTQDEDCKSYAQW